MFHEKQNPQEMGVAGGEAFRFYTVDRRGDWCSVEGDPQESYKFWALRRAEADYKDIHIIEK